MSVPFLYTVTLRLEKATLGISNRNRLDDLIHMQPAGEVHPAP